MKDYFHWLQTRTATWVITTFGKPVFEDKKERALRVLEESLELCQVVGVHPLQATLLVERVYTRPVGNLTQEATGVMISLFGLAEACDIDLASATEIELTRLETPEVREKCRTKYIEKTAAGVSGPSAVA